MISISLAQSVRIAVDGQATITGKVAALNAAHPSGSKVEFLRLGVVIMRGNFLSVLQNGSSSFAINYTQIQQLSAQAFTVNSATDVVQTVNSSGGVIMSGFALLGPTDVAPSSGNYWRLSSASILMNENIDPSSTSAPLPNAISVAIAVAPPAPIVSSPWPNTVTAPASIELQDWSSGSSMVVGTAMLNKPLADTVLQDVTMNADIGTILARGSNASIPWNEFEFGGVALYSATAGIGSLPHFSVLCSFKPRGRWAGYPDAATFDALTDVTHPPAFKVVIKDTTGAILHTHEWANGGPINDRTLSQIRTSTNEQNPLFLCGGMLPWQSTQTKSRANPERLVPGPKNYRAITSVQVNYSANDVIGWLSARYAGQQVNGYGRWDALPRYPMPTGLPSGYGSTNPYLFFGYSGDPGTPIQTIELSQGWGYRAGARGGHNILTGNGGLRHDRFVVPQPIGRWLADPSGVRALNNVPLRQMADEWLLNYFNRYWNWTSDVTTLAHRWPSVSDALEVRQMNGYYGQENQNYATLDKTVDLRAPIQGTSSNVFRAIGIGTVTLTGYATQTTAAVQVVTGVFTKTYTVSDGPFGVGLNAIYPTFFANRFELSGPIVLDQQGSLGVGRGGLTREGHPFWGFEGTDAQHGHQTPNYLLSLFNNPMGIIASRNVFVAQQMTRLGNPYFDFPSTVNSINGYSYQTALQRVYAWNLMHWANAWHVGTSSGFGYRRSDILAALKSELYWYKTNVMDLSISLAASGSLYHQAVLNLGAGVSALPPQEDGSKVALALDWQPMQLYITPVYIFMKTSGLWAELRQEPALAALLDWQIENLMKLCVDYRVNANCAGEYQFDGNPVNYIPYTGGGAYIRISAIKNVYTDFVMADVPVSWAAWYTNMAATGLPTDKTLFKPSGVPEYYAASHLRAQFAWAMRDWFPEYQNRANLVAACNLYDSDYAVIANQVAAATTPYDKTIKEFAFGYTGAWKIKSAVDVGVVL